MPLPRYASHNVLLNRALTLVLQVQVLKSLIYQAICNVLEQDGRIMEAIECFHHMTRELRAEMNTHRDWALGQWLHILCRSRLRIILLDFRQRSSKNLVHFGDTALDSQRHDEAVSNYTTALSLDPPSPQGILIKRSKAYLAAGSWKQALDDSNQVSPFFCPGQSCSLIIRLSCWIRRRHGVTK